MSPPSPAQTQAPIGAVAKEEPSVLKEEAIALDFAAMSDRPSSSIAAPKEEEEEEGPWSHAPCPARAVLNRPWPSPILIPSEKYPGKFRTLLATADTIGPPVTPEELAALEDMDGDDIQTRQYKAAARGSAERRTYIHKHGSLYMDENYQSEVDNSALIEKIRCKRVTVEEMETNHMTIEATEHQICLSELALASYNKRRKVKFELCEPLFCRSFWEDRGFFDHLNFVAKQKVKKKLFFAEIQDVGPRDGEILQVNCCIALDSLSEGGYYNRVVRDSPRSRKGLDLDRCYACHQFLKHPGDGLTYSGGHEYGKTTYLFAKCYN